jgi:hypothetical protein
LPQEAVPFGEIQDSTVLRPNRIPTNSPQPRQSKTRESADIHEVRPDPVRGTPSGGYVLKKIDFSIALSILSN